MVHPGDHTEGSAGAQPQSHVLVTTWSLLVKRGAISQDQNFTASKDGLKLMTLYRDFNAPEVYHHTEMRVPSGYPGLSWVLEVG